MNKVTAYFGWLKSNMVKVLVTIFLVVIVFGSLTLPPMMKLQGKLREAKDKLLAPKAPTV